MRTCGDGGQAGVARCRGVGPEVTGDAQRCEDELVGSPLRVVVYAPPRPDPTTGLQVRTQPCKYVAPTVRRMRVGAVLDEGARCRTDALSVARAWTVHVLAVVDGRTTPAPLALAGAIEC